MENRRKILFVCLGTAVMMACGNASGEKIAKVQGMYADLVEQHNEVVEAYADVEDTSLGEKLDAMAEEIDSIGQQDAQGMSGKELDAIVEELDRYARTYEEMLASLEEIRSREEKPEIYAIPVSIVNNTGVELYEIYLYEASGTDKGENLIGDREYLERYRTLNILNLYVEEEKTLWHLEAVEDGDHVVASQDISFTEKHKDGLVISIEYSFDTMEGWVDLQ